MLPLNPDMAQRDFLLCYGVRIPGEDSIAFEGDNALDGDYIWMGWGSKAVLIYEMAESSFSTPPVTSRSQFPHNSAPRRLIVGQITGHRISISFSTPIRLTHRKMTTSPLRNPSVGFHMLTAKTSLLGRSFISVLRNGYILRPVTHMSWKTCVWKNQMMGNQEMKINGYRRVPRKTDEILWSF